MPSSEESSLRPTDFAMITIALAFSDCAGVRLPPAYNLLVSTTLFSSSAAALITAEANSIPNLGHRVLKHCLQPQQWK